MPVQADGAQQKDPAEVASAIQQSLHEKLHPEEYKEPEPEDGPLKNLMAQQDSLYKYINWEDPVRTLGSYLGILVLLIGAHYLHLTQWALKLGATGLGVVSVASFISRSTKSDFVARLRPEEYKQVPESSLNATLKDIHDLFQYAVVQAQKIIYGEDLDKTFFAFISFTSLYWLIQFVSPFGLTVLGLTSVYVAPLVASPRGREVAHDAKARAHDIAIATSENAKGLAQDGRAKTAEISSKAQETAADTQRRIGDVANSGKQTAANLYNQASGTARNVRNATAENVQRLPELGNNAINRTSDTTRSILDDSKKYINNSRFGAADGHHK